MKLPPMNHAQWCRFLQGRGSLKETHIRCLYADGKCVASDEPRRPIVESPQDVADRFPGRRRVGRYRV